MKSSAISRQQPLRRLIATLAYSRPRTATLQLSTRSTSPIRTRRLPSLPTPISSTSSRSHGSSQTRSSVPCMEGERGAARVAHARVDLDADQRVQGAADLVVDRALVAGLLRCHTPTRRVRGHFRPPRLEIGAAGARSVALVDVEPELAQTRAALRGAAVDLGVGVAEDLLQLLIGVADGEKARGPRAPGASAARRRPGSRRPAR